MDELNFFSQKIQVYLKHLRKHSLQQLQHLYQQNDQNIFENKAGGIALRNVLRTIVKTKLKGYFEDIKSGKDCPSLLKYVESQ